MEKQIAARHPRCAANENFPKQAREGIFPDKLKSNQADGLSTWGRRVWKNVFNAFYSAVVLVLVAMLFIGLQAKVNGELPSLFGYYLFSVKTGSMVPTLPVGCLILSKTPEDPATIQPGTIVTFRFEDGTVVTHRIVARSVMKAGAVIYATKGDNPVNDIDPEMLTTDRVIGIFICKFVLPGFGAMTGGVQQNKTGSAVK